MCRWLAYSGSPLLLDEILIGQDHDNVDFLLGLLTTAVATGTTVVMATHDQRIVNTMRKRVIQLDRGVIVRDQARGVYE